MTGYLACRRAKHLSTQREVAVKTFNKTKICKEAHLATAMKNELDVLKLLQPSAHANIANILEVVESKNALVPPAWFEARTACVLCSAACF